MKMSSRRNKIKIMAEILRIAKGGASKTRIVYRANLNFKVFGDYFKELEKAGLLVEDSEIRTTEKGVNFMENVNDLMEMISYRSLRS